MSADGDGKLNEEDRLQVTGRIIHATWDIAPSEDGETPRPFCTDTERGCASALIKRCVIVFMSYFMYVFLSYFVVNKHQIGHENNNVPLN